MLKPSYLSSNHQNAFHLIWFSPTTTASARRTFESSFLYWKLNSHKKCLQFMRILPRTKLFVGSENGTNPLVQWQIFGNNSSPHAWFDFIIPDFPSYRADGTEKRKAYFSVNSTRLLLFRDARQAGKIPHMHKYRIHTPYEYVYGRIPKPRCYFKGKRSVLLRNQIQRYPALHKGRPPVVIGVSHKNENVNPGTIDYRHKSPSLKQHLNFHSDACIICWHMLESNAQLSVNIFCIQEAEAKHQTTWYDG